MTEANDKKTKRVRTPKLNGATRRNVYLDEPSVVEAQRLGGGDMSHGIRLALQASAARAGVVSVVSDAQRALLHEIENAEGGLLFALMSAAEKRTAQDLVNIGLIRLGRAQLARNPQAYFANSATGAQAD